VLQFTAFISSALATPLRMIGFPQRVTPNKQIDFRSPVRYSARNNDLADTHIVCAIQVERYLLNPALVINGESAHPLRRE
jgi:hypothetical protein